MGIVAEPRVVDGIQSIGIVKLSKVDELVSRHAESTSEESFHEIAACGRDCGIVHVLIVRTLMIRQDSAPIAGLESFYRRASKAPSQTAAYPSVTLPMTFRMPIQKPPSRTAE